MAIPIIEINIEYKIHFANVEVVTKIFAHPILSFSSLLAICKQHFDRNIFNRLITHPDVNDKRKLFSINILFCVNP